MGPYMSILDSNLIFFLLKVHQLESAKLECLGFSEWLESAHGNSNLLSDSKKSNGYKRGRDKVFCLL